MMLSKAIDGVENLDISKLEEAVFVKELD